MFRGRKTLKISYIADFREKFAKNLENGREAIDDLSRNQEGTVVMARAETFGYFLAKGCVTKRINPND